jgi:predicted Fe-Mo cluster-binding NifX family protein
MGAGIQIQHSCPHLRRCALKIAISATGPTLDAEVDPRFGRCQYFLIIDPDTMESEAIDNTNKMASGGAGIASAQAVASKGVQVVLTGNCGPNASQTLSGAGVQVITGVSGKIKDVVEGYRSGRYGTTSGPNVSAHFGMGRGKSTFSGSSKEGAVSNAEQEIGELKSQSEMLRQQLSEVMFRLNQLEKKATP